MSITRLPHQLWKIAVFVCLTLGGGYSVAAEATTEYPLKAAFIYNIARMVNWPNETEMLANNVPVRMCFYGQDYFGKTLDEYETKEVRKRAIKILRNISQEQLPDCHILFISKAEESNLPLILSKVSHAPVLTIGDMPEFAQRGGMMNLVLREDKRLKIEVNLAVAKAAGLTVSGRLLSVADIVEGE